MLKAYFDESGIHTDSKVLVICGYVGPSDVWKTVEEQWKDVLGGRVFHAADLEGGWGEFEGVGPRERTSIKARTIDIVRNSGLLGIASGVIKEDYFKVFNTPDLLAISGSPYEACFQDAIDRALDRSALFVAQDRGTEFVFDQQGQWQGRARKMWGKMMKLSITDWDYRNLAVSLNFASKKEFVPLQVADHLAYETYKYLHNKHYDPARRTRVAMSKLLAWNQNYGRYLDLQGARELYEHLRASGRILPRSGP